MAQGIRTLAIATEVDAENPTIGDLKLVNGDFVWLAADDPEATAQSILRRLRMFRGEWFIDQKLGFPWFQHVLGKGRNISRIKSLLTKAILGTPGVKEVISVEYSIDGATRAMTMSWQARFDDGKIYTSDDFAVPYIVEVA